MIPTHHFSWTQGKARKQDFLMYVHMPECSGVEEQIEEVEERGGRG